MNAYEFVLRLLIMFVGVIVIAWGVDLKRRTDSEFTVLVLIVVGASCLVAACSGVIAGVDF